MAARSLVRVALICLLVAVVGWQLVDYAARMDEQLVYPTGQELAGDFSRYHGQQVDVWLTVGARDGTTFTTTRGWTVTADSLPATLGPGDSVQVYGVARPGPRIDARRVIVTDTPNRRYMYAVSALGLLLAVALTLRYWRPDPASLTVRPRERTGTDRTAPTPAGGDGGD